MQFNRKATREELSGRHPQERRAELLAIREKSHREDRPKFKFRDLKVLIRQKLETQDSYTPDSIQQIDIHTDLLIAIYRKVIESKGRNAQSCDGSTGSRFLLFGSSPRLAP